MCDIFACICEGSFEKAVIDRLLESDCLIFKKEQLLDQDLLDGYYRSGKNFERDYLNKDFGDKKIIVYRILDSIKEAATFKISKKHSSKLKTVNCITHPEIEMLYIISEGKYEEYSRKFKSKLKPSEYVNQILKVTNVKSYKFVYKYFNDVQVLIQAIKTYSRGKTETLHTILKDKYK